MTAAEPLEIAPYRPRWAAEVAQLQRELWTADDERNRRYLSWKYGDNPNGSRLWVARRGGEVIGIRGAVGLWWHCGAARALWLSPTDALVRADMRGQRVFTAMTEAMLAASGDVPFVNLSSHRTSAAGYEQLGWRVIGSWQIAHRLLTYRRQHSLAPGDGAGRPTPFAVLDIHARGRLPGPAIIERRPRPVAMARLVARLAEARAGRMRLRPLRDPRFYRWRYRNPLAQYRFVFIGRDRVRAFAVLQLPPRSAHARINVVDWEGETAVDKALALEAAMTWGDFAGLAVWASSFADEEQAILARLGFGLLDHGSAEAHGLYCPQILVRPGRRGRLGGALADLSRWQLPGIASDQF